jgi:spore coat polysaccharide biosynthesis predicted glycosyltransferase SpsG
MIVVEAGHAHVMKFLSLSNELSFFVAVAVIFLGEKCGDEDFVFKLTIESKSIELLGNQF